MVSKSEEAAENVLRFVREMVAGGLAPIEVSNMVVLIREGLSPIADRALLAADKAVR